MGSVVRKRDGSFQPGKPKQEGQLLLKLDPAALNGAAETFNDRKVERPQRTIEFRSFSDLIDLPPEPEWLWRGYLAPGALTMLAGHPFAGKSMLVGGLLGAMNEGTDFLGRATCKAPG